MRTTTIRNGKGEVISVSKPTPEYTLDRFEAGVTPPQSVVLRAEAYAERHNLNCDQQEAVYLYLVNNSARGRRKR